MEVILMKNKLFIILATITISSIITKVTETFSIESNLTFAMIKPDAVQTKNDNKIIDIIKQHGFEIMAMKKTHLTQKEAENFYSVHKNKSFFCTLITFVISDPVIGMALKKENAIQDWRKLMGATDPKKALTGTIRKLFGTNITENAVHGSDSWQTAQQEISQFFPHLSANFKEKINFNKKKEQQYV